MKDKNKMIIVASIMIFILSSPIFVVANEKQAIKIQNTSSVLNINIVKPKQGRLYLFDKESRSLGSGRTRIFGKITIEIEAADTSSEIDYVELYLDGKLKATLPGPYY